MRFRTILGTSLPGHPATECAREVRHHADGEECARARERVRRGVEEALVALGQGFLAHPENVALHMALRSGALATKEYQSELLRLVYRLILLVTVEERGLLHPDGTSAAARRLYNERYSLKELIERSAKRVGHDGGSDHWEALKFVFRGLARGEPRLGLPALAGIFAPSHCLHLDASKLENSAILLAVLKLAWLPEEHGLSRVNWRDLAPEELGSVYESLLELAPQVTNDARQFAFATGAETKGNTRKTTGSYYTPDSLVQVVLDTALEPVIAETLAKNPGREVDAMLDLSIVDPACGSGHFLLAAARRLASHIAGLRANGTPSASEYRYALRQVISRCIFGVDLNPMAVELCRVGLWMEAVEPNLPLTFLDAHIQCGNALLGATQESMATGTPDAQQADYRHQKLVADAWCAEFVWPKLAPSPPRDLWRLLRDRRGEEENLPPPMIRTLNELAEQFRFFHWHLQFPQVFAKGGFDVVLGNPPWVAHAGRAAQPLPPGLRAFFVANHESFAEYPTTHGVFVGHIPRILRMGGRLGFIVPSSISELGGYAPTRRAHDRLCDFPAELVDFGEGRFPGVTQPCMALSSRRARHGRTDAARGEPWPMARPDLTPLDRALLRRLGELPVVPPELFGERGFQSDRELAAHFVESSVPHGRFTCPIREGTDVRAFCLLPPRFHVDRPALRGRIRSDEEFQEVGLVVRQTARYPIAALSDGVAFRNSLLAGFDLPGWPAQATVALLNAALIRWLHYQRFRDARQPVMPQVKIGHLRSIPAPPGGIDRWASRLGDLAARLASSDTERADPDAREQLDALVADLYGLSAEERTAVNAWHQAVGSNGRPRLQGTPRREGR